MQVRRPAVLEEGFVGRAFGADPPGGTVAGVEACLVRPGEDDGLHHDHGHGEILRAGRRPGAAGEQGITDQDAAAANVEAGRARGMPRGVDDPDRGSTDHERFAIGEREVWGEGKHFGVGRVDINRRPGRSPDLGQRTAVVRVTVGEQDPVHAGAPGECQY